MPQQNAPPRGPKAPLNTAVSLYFKIVTKYPIYGTQPQIYFSGWFCAGSWRHRQRSDFLFFFLNSYKGKKRSILGRYALLCQVQECNYKFNNELIMNKGEIFGNTIFPVSFVFLIAFASNPFKICIPHTKTSPLSTFPSYMKQPLLCN